MRPILFIVVAAALLTMTWVTLGRVRTPNVAGIPFSTAPPSFSEAADGSWSVAGRIAGCPVDAVSVHVPDTWHGMLQVQSAGRGVEAPDGRALQTPVPTARTPDGPLVLHLPVQVTTLRSPVVLKLVGRDDMRAGYQLTPELVELSGPGSRGAWGAIRCIVNPDQTAVFAGFVISGVLVCLSVAWLVCQLIGGGNARPRWHCVVLVVCAASASWLWAVVVPPLEGPDEQPHARMVNYLQRYHALPREAPARDSPWYEGAYEWQQPPVYYIIAASLWEAAGLDDSPIEQTRNPRSRLAGGSEWTLYEHNAIAGDTWRSRIWLLRSLGALIAGLTILAAFAALLALTGDPLRSATAAMALALVPQWSAVMMYVSNDGLATLVSAAGVLLLVRAAVRNEARPTMFLALGAFAGLAICIKLTTLHLAAAGLLLAACSPGGLRTRVVRGSAFAAGIAAIAMWIPVRDWIVFGDPMARQFKQQLLTAAGIVVPPSPAPWSALPGVLRRSAIEPFWARFGSLGAGPYDGSRMWLLYFFLTGAGAVGITAAMFETLRGRLAASRYVPLAGAIVAAAAPWIWLNLDPQEFVPIGWSPRYLQPATIPALILVATGLFTAATRLRVPPALARAAAGLLLSVLCVAYFSCLSWTALQFHFGYR